ncbi:hypothetical protein TcWFU_003163 [Taenia crassiceps]|uniref:Uncharacterized protein n=1 Tax=Taenia crassiceps TaxID=6207 RepID=A0ABR4QG42_9CEST
MQHLGKADKQSRLSVVHLSSTARVSQSPRPSPWTIGGNQALIDPLDESRHHPRHRVGFDTIDWLSGYHSSSSSSSSFFLTIALPPFTEPTVTWNSCHSSTSHPTEHHIHVHTHFHIQAQSQTLTDTDSDA